MKDQVGRFYVVTLPRLSSTVPDIAFETNVEGFALQVLGGLDRDSVVGLYRTEEEAHAVAFGLIEAVKVARS